MAKKNVEKKIKEVLDERTIAPSENAWGHIEAQLGASTEKVKQGYWVYGIAAGFIGILMVSIFFRSESGTEVVPIEQVVKVTEYPLEEADIVETKNSLETLAEDQEEMEDAAVFPGNKAMRNMTPLQLAQQSEPKEEQVVEDYVSLEKVDTKIAAVLTEVALLEQTQGSISDATVDSLLRTAQMELLGERMVGTSQSVDALALLSDVEDELNKSLRDQLFEKLKDGYVKVRTAIAYRNE